MLVSGEAEGSAEGGELSVKPICGSRLNGRWEKGRNATESVMVVEIQFTEGNFLSTFRVENFENFDNFCAALFEKTDNFNAPWF